MRSFSTLILASLAALILPFPAHAGPKKQKADSGKLSEKAIREQLLGTWLGKKYETFLSTGKWLLKKTPGDSPTIGLWFLNGNKLSIFNPEAGNFTERVISISSKKMVLQDEDGKTEYERVD